MRQHLRDAAAVAVAGVLLVAGCWAATAAIVWAALWPVRVLARLIGATP